MNIKSRSQPPGYTKLSHFICYKLTEVSNQINVKGLCKMSAYRNSSRVHVVLVYILILIVLPKKAAVGKPEKNQRRQV